ncbi:uncharacterized protein [Aquarana catesbeiana]|uniref:uncharacterized protein isoform X1 n=1 Tax=Aquarana catesbeiana TaxID=8400 RepID=UPI003CCA03BC
MGRRLSKEVSLAICSRDSEENYRWLQDHLENKMFHHTKVVVHPVYISNNASEFYKVAPRHDFAILYHTKKRGRVNVTNVTDSLYDQELRYLHDKLGKKSVVVVIDDLEESGDHDKNRIQSAQEDLHKYACNLFLFSTTDKNHINGQRRVQGGVADKLKALKKEIKTGRRKAKRRKSTKERYFTRGSVPDGLDRATCVQPPDPSCLH